jgi:hypothetical protein
MKKKSVTRAANKSAFVRRYPKASVKDVVALGAKAGLKFTEKYVYAVRWKTAAKFKAKSVVVRVPADVGKAFVARRKAAKKAAQAVTLGEPEGDKVIALTYKSNLTRDADGGWRVATKPVPAPEVTPITPVTRDRHFKQLALEIGLTQAYVLLAELRASVLTPE